MICWMKISKPLPPPGRGEGNTDVMDKEKGRRTPASWPWIPASAGMTWLARAHFFIASPAALPASEAAFAVASTAAFAASPAAVTAAVSICRNSL